MSIHRSSGAEGVQQQDATQSFCENSSASCKRSLNVKFVLIYILHDIIVCDLLHPIVACRTLHGSTDPPCTLDMRIYPSDMMIVPLVLSYQNSIPTIIGRFRGVDKTRPTSEVKQFVDSWTSSSDRPSLFQST